MVAAGVFIRISGLAAPYPANIYFAFRIMGFGAILLATICIGLAISLTKRNELLVNKLDEISKPDKQKRSKK